MSNVNQLQKDCFDVSKKNGPNQFKILGKNQSALKKKLREMLKPIRFKIIKNQFEEKTKREIWKNHYGLK